MLSIVAFLFVLGFLIFIHELGHFIAARNVGIRVETFSLGFGPRLIGFKKGDTDYRISLIPLGGYVKMAGENPDEPHTGADDELNAKSIPQRFYVIVAGALMNALAAIVITAFLGYIGIKVPAYTTQAPEVGWIKPDSTAAESGFQVGDLIVSINGSKVDTWEETLQKLFLNPEKPSTVLITRDGRPREIQFTPGTSDFGGLGFKQDVIVQKISKDSPAEVNDIQPGDQILAINGQKVSSTNEVIFLVQQYKGEPLELKIKRDSQLVNKTLAPEFSEDDNRYLIGINFDIPMTIKKYGALEAVKMSFVTNYELSAAMIDLVGQLVTGQASLKNLGGPVMIGVLAGEAAKEGIRDLLWLTSFISLNLAIINLLPIPLLDGGMILFLIIEAIRRRPLSEKVQLVIQNIFFVLLITFALVVIYNDILRFS